EEAGEEREEQSHPTAAPGRPAQPMAEGESEVGDDAGDVGGADDRAAVGGGHRVLEAAGGGGTGGAGDGNPGEQRHGEGQEGAFDDEHHAVAATGAQVV